MLLMQYKFFLLFFQDDHIFRRNVVLLLDLIYVGVCLDAHNLNFLRRDRFKYLTLHARRN